MTALNLTPEFLSRPVYTLTVGEFFNLIKAANEPTPTPEPAPIPAKAKTPIRGIYGLAKFLECSPVTAQKLKNSGKIPFAQHGRLVYFDPDKVMESMANGKPRKHRNNVNYKTLNINEL